MQTENAVEAIKAKLKELDHQNATVAEAFDAYQADRKALQRTLELLLKEAPKGPVVTRPRRLATDEKRTRPESAASAESSNVEYGGLIEAVREFAKTASGKFTTKDAENYLKAEHPAIHAKLKPGALSGTFFKLREAGAIKLVEQGSGRRPSLYVKP